MRPLISLKNVTLLSLKIVTTITLFSMTAEAKENTIATDTATAQKFMGEYVKQNECTYHPNHFPVWARAEKIQIKFLEIEGQEPSLYISSSEPAPYNWRYWTSLKLTGGKKIKTVRSDGIAPLSMSNDVFSVIPVERYEVRKEQSTLNESEGVLHFTSVVNSVQRHFIFGSGSKTRYELSLQDGRLTVIETQNFDSKYDAPETAVCTYLRK